MTEKGLQVHFKMSGLVDGNKGDIVLRTDAGFNVRAGGMTVFTGMTPGACLRSVAPLSAEAGVELEW